MKLHQIVKAFGHTSQLVMLHLIAHTSIPPYATDSVQSSPQAVKRSMAHSPRTKKKRSDRTETSNSWEAEKIEDSVTYVHIKQELENCGKNHKNLL